MKMNNIPHELQEMHQWVVYGVDESNPKCPYNPTTMKTAKAGDPSTWSNFMEASHRVKVGEAQGVGFQFHNNGIYGVDLDHVLINNKLTPEAQEIVDMLDSYTEISPSGMGLHILVRADGVELERHKVKSRDGTIFEMYYEKRYFTLTGDVYGTPKPIEERTVQLQAIYNKYFKPIPVDPPNTQTVVGDYIRREDIAYKTDEDYLKIGLKRDAGLNNLLQGNRPNGNESADDIALINKLAYWCNRSEDLIHNAFLSSPHYAQKDGEHKKKCERQDYIPRTIKKAITDTTTTARDKDAEYHTKNNAKNNTITQGEMPLTKDTPAKKTQIEFINPFNTPEKTSRYTWDDMGLGYLFADTFKKVIRFVPEAKSWYYYNNKLWKPDMGNLKVSQQGKTLINCMKKFASTLSEEKVKEAYLDFLKKRTSKNNRDIMIRDAESEYPISINQFDKDIYVFNCRNGTLRLQTMEFTEHRAEDLLSKISNVVYDPKAKCERWERFIEEIFCNDMELARFFQKVIGYCITGDTTQECLFILYGGTTRNGKSTAIETILYLLGDYGKTAQPDTLAQTQNYNSGNASEDVARLKGARLVNVSEPSKGLKLDIAKVKQLTGGDMVTARFLYQNSFEYKPEYKISMNSNHLPKVNDQTLFSSERVHVIPFQRHFEPEEQDKGLKSFFMKQENISGILNWCLDGYRLFREEGLTRPQAVIDATTEYKEDSDIIGTFLDDTFVPFRDNKIKTKEVYEAYTDWCNENGHLGVYSLKNLIEDLRNRELVKRDANLGNVLMDHIFIKDAPKGFYNTCGTQNTTCTIPQTRHSCGL